MKPALEPFVYSPLGPGQIRLLEHNVSDDSSEPTWSLRVVDIGEADHDNPGVEFDALSYTWGPLTETFSLQLNGQEIQIHKSLHVALPYLAMRPSPRPIWVDAVCINQKDNDEKMVQIRKMNDVYRRATQVWVWLGPGLEHTAEAIEALPLIVQAGESNLPPSAGPPDNGPPPELPPLSSPIWASILDIISNGWFGRVWVVQESSLAQDLRFLVGAHEIDGEVLRAATTAAGPLAERFYNESMRDEARQLHDTQRSMAIFGIRDLVQKSFSSEISSDPDQPRAPNHLVWIIYQMTLSMRCFDPRDRVYGTLGLLTDEQRDFLGDFSNTASLADLYASYGQQLLIQPRPVPAMWFALLHRGTMPGKANNLPSWCPDFHQSSEELVAWYEDGITLGLDPRRGFNASSKNIVASPGGNIHELVSRGCFVDDVSHIHERIPIALDFLRREVNQTGVLQAYLHLRKFERSIAQNYLSSAAFEITESLKPLTEADDADKASITHLWKTLFSGFRTFQGGEVTVETYYALRRGLDEITASVDGGGTLENNGVFSSLISNAQFQKGFYCAMYSILHRRVFVTSKGRIGLGGGSTRVGDRIFLFNGGQMPHVVRHDSGEKHSLVCEAYLSGAMDGELESLDLPEVDITLI